MMGSHSILCGGMALLLGIASAIPAWSQSKNPKKDPDRIGDRDIGSGINFYSLEKEVALGKQLAQEIERQAKFVDDPIAAEFVNRLAQNLAHNSDIKVPVTAKLIDSSEVNAFALPGGFLFVNSGLVTRAETEAELAGPMAHEIAHVAARHGTRQASRGQIVNWASLSLIFLGGWPGFAVRQGASLAIPVAFLKFSRGFEEEADLLAVQYAYKAGYDPTAFVDFFEKLEAQEKKKPGTVSDLFRSHPNVTSRIRSTQKMIQELMAHRQEYVVNTSEFQDVRQQLIDRENRRKIAPAKTGPTLRRSAEGRGRDDKDERPTLKRRPE